MRKWSIGKKLGAGFTGLVVCIVVQGLVSLWAANTSRDELTEMSSTILRESELSGSIHVRTWTIRAELRAMLLAAAVHHPQDIQKSRANGEQAFAKLEDELTEIRPLLMDPKAKAEAEGLALMLPQWKDAFGEIADLAAAGKVQAAYKVRAEKEHPLANQIEEGPIAIRAGQRATADMTLADANQHAAGNRWLIVASIGMGLLLGALVFGMVRGLVKTLRETVKELRTGGVQVSAASTQIASTSQTLSQGASEQAASVEEISASMEEMTAMARRNGDSSAEATAMMSETAKQVERSNLALSDMVASMSAIKASSEKVAKINKTIDEIAFQTNILALNAAVEAARAGEAGMGFAVVADEVRSLAQRSAVAAKDTAALIEESITNSTQGAQRLEQVSTAIRGITESAGKVKSLLDEVNESSKQQGQGIAQVSTAIQQVSTVTQTSAASAEESAAAAEELSAQSQNVREWVSVLAEMVEGAGARREASHAPARKARFAKRESAKSGEDPFPMESAERGSFRNF
jgi:methyl-accepting chemotaxis protein